MGSRRSSTALRRTSTGLRRIAGLASATSSSSSDAARAEGLADAGRAAAFVSAGHSSKSLEIIGLPWYQHLRPSIIRQDQKPPEPALVLHCCLASAVPPMMSAVTP